MIDDITGEGGGAAILSADYSVEAVQEFTSDGKSVRDAFARLRARL